MRGDQFQEGDRVKSVRGTRVREFWFSAGSAGTVREVVGAPGYQLVRVKIDGGATAGFNPDNLRKLSALESLAEIRHG